MAYVPIRSLSDVQARLVIGSTLEDHWLDFKREPWADPKECAQDIAQFANASGGSIVLGAADTDNVLSGFVTVPQATAVGQWVDTVLKNTLEPTPPIEACVISFERDKTLVVVNVPPAPVLIARRSGEAYEFPMRAGLSKRYLRLLEVEARMYARERLQRLRIERIDPNDSVGLDAFVRRELDHNDWRIVDVDDDVVRLRKGVLEVSVPLTYVETVYRAGEPQAEWIISLSCYLTLHKTKGFIQLTKSQPFGTQQDTYRQRRMASDTS